MLITTTHIQMIIFHFWAFISVQLGNYFQLIDSRNWLIRRFLTINVSNTWYMTVLKIYMYFENCKDIFFTISVPSDVSWGTLNEQYDGTLSTMSSIFCDKSVVSFHTACSDYFPIQGLLFFLFKYFNFEKQICFGGICNFPFNSLFECCATVSVAIIINRLTTFIFQC